MGLNFKFSYTISDDGVYSFKYTNENYIYKDKKNIHLLKKETIKELQNIYDILNADIIHTKEISKEVEKRHFVKTKKNIKQDNRDLLCIKIQKDFNIIEEKNNLFNREITQKISNHKFANNLKKQEKTFFKNENIINSRIEKNSPRKIIIDDIDISFNKEENRNSALENNISKISFDVFKNRKIQKASYINNIERKKEKEISINGKYNLLDRYGKKDIYSKEDNNNNKSFSKTISKEIKNYNNFFLNIPLKKKAKSGKIYDKKNFLEKGKKNIYSNINDQISYIIKQDKDIAISRKINTFEKQLKDIRYKQYLTEYAEKIAHKNLGEPKNFNVKYASNKKRISKNYNTYDYFLNKISYKNLFKKTEELNNKFLKSTINKDIQIDKRFFGQEKKDNKKISFDVNNTNNMIKTISKKNINSEIFSSKNFQGRNINKNIKVDEVNFLNKEKNIDREIFNIEKKNIMLNDLPKNDNIYSNKKKDISLLEKTAIQQITNIQDTLEKDLSKTIKSVDLKLTKNFYIDKLPTKEIMKIKETPAKVQKLDREMFLEKFNEEKLDLYKRLWFVQGSGETDFKILNNVDYEYPAPINIFETAPEFNYYFKYEELQEYFIEGEYIVELYDFDYNQLGFLKIDSVKVGKYVGENVNLEIQDGSLSLGQKYFKFIITSNYHKLNYIIIRQPVKNTNRVLYTVCEKFLGENRHPIPFGNDMGRKEIPVHINIMVEFINILLLVWQKMFAAFGSRFGIQAIIELLDLVYTWLNLETSKENLYIEDYFRCFQWLRWEAEKVYNIAKEDPKLNGNEWIHFLILEMIDYMEMHHFNIMPILKDVRESDIWRSAGFTSPYLDTLALLNKSKGVRKRITNYDMLYSLSKRSKKKE